MKNIFMFLGKNGCGMTTYLWHYAIKKNGVFISSEYPDGWQYHFSRRKSGQKKGILGLPLHIHESTAIEEKFDISSGGMSGKEMVATISAAITAIRCGVPLIVDGFATFLHSKNQHKLLRIMKGIVTDNPGFRFIFSTHRRELIGAFAHNIKEPGLVKGGYIVEGTLKNDRFETWDEVWRCQTAPYFIPGTDPHEEGCLSPADVSIQGEDPPQRILRQFSTRSDGSVVWTCPNDDCRRQFFYKKEDLPAGITIPE